MKVLAMAQNMTNAHELVREEVKRMLLEPLRAQSIILQNGPVIFDSPQGAPLVVPRLTDEGDEPEYYAESEEIDDTELDFGEFTLLPSNLKSLKNYYKFSNELARHSIVPIGATAQAALVRGVQTKLDKEFVKGAGTVGTDGKRGIVGLWNQATVTGTWDNSDGGALQDSIDGLIGQFLGAEITDLSRTVLFVNNADYMDILAVRDPQGRSYLVPDLTQPGNYQLRGIKVQPTKRLDAGEKLFVDFSKVAVGRDLAPSVKLFDQTHAQTDELAIRVVCRFDIGVMYPEGVIKVTG